MRIIYSELSYDVAVAQAKCSSVRARRDLMCTRSFEKIRHPVSRLNHLILPSRETEHNCILRNGDRLTLFPCKTERFKKSFFPVMCRRFYSF